MKTPGPDHPITIAPYPKRLQVLFGGHLIGETTEALVLKEASYPPVFYIPRKDVEMAVLARSEHRTRCPYKGEASYFTISRDGRFAENAVWSYENPYPAMAEIAGRLAFYPDQVEFLERDEGAADPATIREAIEHTDSGSGRSQLDHWPPDDPSEAH